MKIPKGKWVGVDFDNTLVIPESQSSTAPYRIARPIAELVKKLLDAGVEVRIFTARGTSPNALNNRIRLQQIEDTCKTLFGRKLPITSEKDELVHAIIDDRAVSVVKDTGRYVDPNKLLEGV